MCGICGKEPCECAAVVPNRMTSVKSFGGLSANATATVRMIPKPAQAIPPVRVVQIGASRALTTPTLRSMGATVKPRMGTYRLSGADIAEVHDEATRAHRTLAAVMMPMITDVNASAAKRQFIAEAIPVLHGCAMTAQAMAGNQDSIDDASLAVVERAAALAAKAREIA